MASILVGCGNSNIPRFRRGETVRYSVPHMTESRVVNGEATVINCELYEDGWYYDIDNGKLDAEGEPERVTVHEKCLKKRR